MPAEKTNLNRRQFGILASSAAFLSGGAVFAPSIAKDKARVVIIGGGPAGTTVANRLKSLNGNLDITLIEPKTIYTTCFISNTYIGGFRSFSSLTHNYKGVEARGINVVHDKATAIDLEGRIVRLSNSDSELAFDRLVVAPGIDLKFDDIEGYSLEAAQVMPHAWTGGEQTLLLKKKLLAMEDGGVVVMTVPDNPYRCPPGPYERACMIAHVLKAVKPKSKLILFDAKKTYSKQAVFEEAYQEYYKDIIEINLTNEIDDFSVASVDPKTGIVETRAGRREKAALANIIPPQRAGAIAHAAGLADGDWCPINPHNFTSTLVPGVYVLGDASIAKPMPKSAYSAISQGNLVAEDIAADLAQTDRPAGKFKNTCWSMLAPDNSVKIGANYMSVNDSDGDRLDVESSFISQRGESNQVRRETFREGAAWYDSTVANLFNEETSKDH